MYSVLLSKFVEAVAEFFRPPPLLWEAGDLILSQQQGEGRKNSATASTNSSRSPPCCCEIPSLHAVRPPFFQHKHTQASIPPAVRAYESPHICCVNFKYIALMTTTFVIKKLIISLSQPLRDFLPFHNLFFNLSFFYFIFFLYR